jgi:hypothetical protein
MKIFNLFYDIVIGNMIKKSKTINLTLAGEYEEAFHIVDNVHTKKFPFKLEMIIYKAFLSLKTKRFEYAEKQIEKGFIA